MKNVLTEEGREKMLDQLKRHEGAVRDKNGMHTAYRCSAGALTIGYGHNLDANPVNWISQGTKLSEEQATLLLDNDVSKFEYAVQSSLPWCVDLDEPRYAVLVNMAFNMGLRGLMSFKNTLTMIERGDYAAAAKGMLSNGKGGKSKWYCDVKGRAEELSRQMETGEWQEG